MSARVLLIFALALFVCGSAAAFDGKRQGFVFGVGTGMNPYTRISPEPSDSREKGLALQALFGYAQNDHNLLALEGNISTRFFASHGFFGPTWYRYFGKPGKAFYSALGLGMYYYNEDKLFGESTHHEKGFGYMIGGGYEFARHIQMGVYYAGGTTHFDNVDYSLGHFSVMVTFAVF